ncbi:non-homologous end-joining DNA ligase [Alsobacter sp. SYSU M60028]|uniref:Non-homologous end-joining DNA ligase n=1 Tax=Alsobacter ponti TaxID=2962936 RepID=A0ABT1LFF6_9HYPH|nr:non-homologous end-joining DNA ligase [Alsobacter ponti]MCP8940225.1 non-homologous end-joining DNA ligase [Alsobacter ponti]
MPAARRATAKPAAETAEIAGVRLTHPDKVLYPEQGITKRDLAAYYEAVAPAMLPHVADRPITLVRCPTGRRSKCFYQRHAGSGVPASLSRVTVPGLETSGAYLYLRDATGLVSLVQLGVLEIHPWGVRVDEPTRPDRVILDLDPGEGLAFSDVVAAARDVRRELEEAGLVCFVKTTGGKGLHVVAPLTRDHEWPQVKAFARAMANRLGEREPDRFLTRIAKAERVGRIFIDYLRNDATSTAVAPYSSRAREGAPVATPLEWDELRPGLDPAAFNVRTIPDRLKTKGDPWADIARAARPLPRAP